MDDDDDDDDDDEMDDEDDDNDDGDDDDSASWWRQTWKSTRNIKPNYVRQVFKKLFFQMLKPLAFANSNTNKIYLNSAKNLRLRRILSGKLHLGRYYIYHNT